MKYCESIYETRRFKTREIKVGSIGVGGRNPIRIQSMTTTNTRDVQATIQQIISLADVGCEMARVTVQGKKEAESCEAIKTGLLQKGYSIPLIADIHFYPPAAMLAVEFVDKIRINPGNFADKRALFKVIEYDDASYERELQKIEEVFAPLVLKCKRLKKAMRIGANHGSLSDRIMNRFGDTPKGMVESAFEFARICQRLDYHEFCFSMKASNPLVMIEAYRLLAARMIELGWDYPLHLGVTEAGAGEDGRIKSAVGIGALLLDGLGDTIRVSLTEDPIHEIGPCKELASLPQKGILPFSEMTREPRFEKIEPIVHVKGTLPPENILLFRPETSPLHETRKLVQELKKKGDTRPLIVELAGAQNLHLAAQFGAILCDRLAEGVSVEDEQFGYDLLQATRLKMTKTDFISCPGCGRTLFDLQEVSKRIREKTGHLVGVKIAIMGCIVNGPGEMADADFGYVGSKAGKIDLYIGKNCIEKEIDSTRADEALIALIKSHGKWTDPVV